MNELAQFCKQLKQDFIPKIKDPRKPVSFWSEKDVLHEKVVDAFVIIFRTRGCSWALKSGCSMCGYFNDSLWPTPNSFIQGMIENELQLPLLTVNAEELSVINSNYSFMSV